MIGVSRATILGASNLGGGGEYAVGSFTAQTSLGNQAVTGLGFTPKAIIFWTSQGGTALSAGNWMSGIVQSLGFTSGPTESYSVSGASQDAVGTSNTGRRIASKAITCVDYSGTASTGEADLVSFDVDGFTIDWTTAPGAAWQFMFMAIGGPAVEAKVVNWTSPTAVGNKAVTGVGFTPDVVLHAASALLTMPESDSPLITGFGAMDGAGNQWTNAVDAQDGQSTSNTSRYQRIDKCIATLNGGGGVFEEAEFVSMDADGFTTNFTTAGASARQHISLCLSGVDAKVGNFAKTTDAAPASQAITGVGFEPAAVMLSSTTGTPSTAVNSTAFWHLGGADGTNERTTGQVDLDGAPTTNAESFWKDDKALAIAGGVGSIFAEADLTSFNADGFTLNWTTNGGSSYEVLYLSLG